MLVCIISPGYPAYFLVYPTLWSQVGIWIPVWSVLSITSCGTYCSTVSDPIQPEKYCLLFHVVTTAQLFLIQSNLKSTVYYFMWYQLLHCFWSRQISTVYYFMWYLLLHCFWSNPTWKVVYYFMWYLLLHCFWSNPTWKILSITSCGTNCSTVSDPARSVVYYFTWYLLLHCFWSSQISSLLLHVVLTAPLFLIQPEQYSLLLHIIPNAPLFLIQPDQCLSITSSGTYCSTVSDPARSV